MGPCSQKMVELKTDDDFQQFCLYEGMKMVVEEQIERHYQDITKKNGNDGI